MPTLEVNKCAGFIAYAHLKVKTTRWLGILKEYAQKHEDASGLAVGSWYENMKKGKPFQDSLVKMKVRFPACVESLLIQGYESSVLDYVLKDMNTAFKKHYRTKDIYDALSLLVDEQATKPKSVYICQGCMIREIERILKRAKLERAHEIIFEQDDDKYFIQRYLGPKAVTYIEPCHSKTYKTMMIYLNAWSESHKLIKLAKRFYKIVKSGDKRYLLSDNKISLSLSFI